METESGAAQAVVSPWVHTAFDKSKVLFTMLLIMALGLAIGRS